MKISADPPADDEFWVGVRRKVRQQEPVLVLERIARGAGAREWFLVSRSEDVERARDALSHGSCITIYSDPDLPLHGCLTDALVEQARDLLRQLGDHDELLALSAGRTPPRMEYEYIADEDELSQFADERCGEEVWIGRYPDWPSDSDTVVTAYVADADGVVRRHPY